MRYYLVTITPKIMKEGETPKAGVFTSIEIVNRLSDFIADDSQTTITPLPDDLN